MSAQDEANVKRAKKIPQIELGVPRQANVEREALIAVLDNMPYDDRYLPHPQYADAILAAGYRREAPGEAAASPAVRALIDEARETARLSWSSKRADLFTRLADALESSTWPQAKTDHEA